MNGLCAHVFTDADIYANHCYPDTTQGDHCNRSDGWCGHAEQPIEQTPDDPVGWCILDKVVDHAQFVIHLCHKHHKAAHPTNIVQKVTRTECEFMELSCQVCDYPLWLAPPMPDEYTPSLQ